MAQEVIEVVERQVEVIEILERGLAGPTGPAGASPNINYEVVSSSQQVSNRQFIAADTSGGSITLTLPLNPDNGDAIDIFDYAETFDTNPLTIARNGQPIESLNEDLTANVEGAYFTLIYTGSTRGWQVVPRFGTSGGGGESALTTEGDMLYRGSAINTRLPIGTAGQVLKVNSGATAPEWGSAPDSIDDYTVVTTSQTIANGARIAADTSGGSFTLTLPATPPNGATVYILDYAQTFDTNPLTLARNGSQIEGESQNMECGVKGSSFKMVFTGSANGGWRMIPFFGVAGVASVSGTAPIVSSGGATPTISITPATTSAAGSMSAADKVKLNGAAPLESPALTGTPTAPTASAGTNTTQIATTAFTLANRGDRYLTTSTSSHSITTGSKTFTVQSGLSYTATQDITIVYDGNPTGQHMHGVVTSYSGTTLVVNVESVEGSGGPFTAWTINVGGLLTAQGALLEANNLSDVANPATALTNIGGVPTSRSISAGTGLTGGGNLTADRTLAVSYGSSAGTACEGNDARLSDSRTPTAHAASHATGGSDPLAPSDIGAIPQWSVFQETVSASPTTLATGRARRITISTTLSTDTEVLLPTTGNQDADLFQLIRSGNIANGRILVKQSAGGSTLADLGTKDNEGRSFTFRWQTGGSFWAVVPVDAHSADKVTSGTLDIARIPTGTGSTEVAAGDHGHGNITSDGKLGSTSGLPVVTTTAGAVSTLALGAAGTVLTVNSGANGVEFAAASGGGGEVRFDTNSSYTYTGLASAGTSESTASWLIRRSEFDGAGSHVATTTANNVEWDDRLTASYS